MATKNPTKPVDVKMLKSGLLATLKDMYGRANPRLEEVVDSLDIFFYIDEDSMHEIVDTEFNKTKYKTIGKFIKQLPIKGDIQKRELAMYSLLGSEEEGHLVLGDGCALNIACNMLAVGPEIYIQDLTSEKKKKYIHACKHVLDALELTDKPRIMQQLVLNKLNQARVEYVEGAISTQGQIGRDYLSVYYQTIAKSSGYIDYIKQNAYISARDRKIVEECGIDSNVLENLSMVGIYYGTDLTSPGDIIAFSKDADRKLQKGDMEEVIYKKRVKVMEYINGLPARVLEKDETWESVYKDYIKQGYKKLKPEDVADLEEYRKILVRDIVSCPSQIENIIYQIENPMGDDGYLVPTSINRNLFLQENSGFIPNAKKDKYVPFRKRGVIILNDNVHMGSDLALKNFLHEAGHALISEIHEIEGDNGVVIKDAMFGLFKNDTKAGIDENGEIIPGYHEPVHLIENINERKTVEMLYTYMQRTGVKNPFDEKSGLIYNYINTYRVGNFITELFYERFKGVINRDLATGKYSLRDAVGKDNIMALENLLEEFHSSRVKRELFNTMLLGIDKNHERFLPPDVKAEYDDFQRRATEIVNKMTKYNFRVNNKAEM